MGASRALALREEDDEDSGLTARQVQALEKLIELGAEPRKPGEPTSSNPQIRAYQLIYEGSFGGPGKGQGRKRAPRAAEQLAEDIRDLAPKMKRVLKRAMKEDAGIKANLDAVKLAVDIERGERKLQIEEEEHDQIGDTREEIIGALFELVANPAVSSALRQGVNGEEVIDVNEDDITEAQVVGGEEEGSSPIHFDFVVEEDNQGASAAGSAGRNGDSSGPAPDGGHTGSPRRNGRKRVAFHRPEGPNPFTEAKRRRAAD